MARATVSVKAFLLSFCLPFLPPALGLPLTRPYPGYTKWATKGASMKYSLQKLAATQNACSIKQAGVPRQANIGHSPSRQDVSIDAKTLAQSVGLHTQERSVDQVAHTLWTIATTAEGARPCSIQFYLIYSLICQVGCHHAMRMARIAVKC